MNCKSNKASQGIRKGQKDHSRRRRSRGPQSASDGGRKDRCLATEVEKIVVGEGGQEDRSQRTTKVGRTVVDKGGHKDHSQRATEVEKTVFWRWRSEGPWSAKTVKRTVVSGQWRSKRPLSGDGDQKDHSQRRRSGGT
ncbi:hypothetical protein M5K25_022293 [Dendrobium thyrsiflorum]|uniref:Uncharacterized protein n=1 Tax=Dendrobium thyrsiflorum TaxID=117978 RepID=A0ABD0U5V7_DENTH